VAAVVGFGGGEVTMVGMDDGSGSYDDGAEMVRMLREAAAVVDGSGGGV
nr:hypothetical protein [Tanacetum cinerariifolium]